MLTRLRDPHTRQRLKKEISEEQTAWENIYLGSGGPEWSFDQLGCES